MRVSTGSCCRAALHGIATARTIENRLTRCRQLIRPVWVYGRTNLIKIDGERIKLLITLPALNGIRFRQLFEIRPSLNESRIVREVVGALVHCRVTRQVCDGLIPLQASTVKVMAIVDTRQIWHLDGIKEASAMPGLHASGDGSRRLHKFVEGH